MLTPKYRSQSVPSGALRIAIGSALVLVMVGGSVRATTSERVAYQTFSDEVLVKEVGLIIDSRNVMPRRHETTLEAVEFSVVEDGSMRQVTRLDKVSDLPRRPKAESADSEEAGPWSIVIYIDRQLARPSSVVASTFAIAKRTSELKDLGALTVVVADPVPKVLLERSQAPSHVAKVLLDIAEEDRVERDKDPLHTDSPSSGRDQPSSTVIRRQWDRLISFLADTIHDGPRALLLVEEGFLLSAEDVRALSGRAESPLYRQPGQSLAAVVMDTAQALSSYGWVTIPISLGYQPPDRQESAPDEFNEWRDTAQTRFSSREQRTTINFFGTTKPGKPTAELDDRLYEAYSLPRLAPLRALAEATGGAVAWHEGQLETALAELDGRWLLGFQTPDPHDGRIRRIEVVHQGSAKHFRAPWWIRSSTPDLVAEARLRLVLAGEEPSDAHLPLSVRVVPETAKRDGSGLDIDFNLRIPAAELADESSPGHFRFSIAQPGPESTMVVQHTIDFEAPALGKEWNYILPAKLHAGVGAVAVAVEDLSREEWGVVLLDLGELQR